MTRSTDDRGAALAVTVFGLALVGALIAAGFLAAIDESRQTMDAARAQRTFFAAERGLARLLDAAAQGRRGAGGGGVVTRLGAELFLLDVAATDSSAVYRRRLGLLARRRSPSLPIGATLTTRGAPGIEGGAAIEADVGTDSCPPLSGTVVAVKDTTVPLDAARYRELASEVTPQLPGGTYEPGPVLGWDGTCDTLVATNWGDAVASGGGCAGTSRAVRLAGDAWIVGGRGAGILLVDGDLTVVGPFEYAGLIIVAGRLAIQNTAAAPARLLGAVVSINRDGASQQVAGNVQMSYSNCSINNALRLVSRPTQLRSRGWIQLF